MPERMLMEQLNEAIDAMLAGKRIASAGPAVSRFMTVVSRLRDLPDDRFKTRLGRELQTFPAVHTITPFICVPEGAKLIEFMKNTFGAVETNRHPHGPDGFIAAVRIGDSNLLVMGGESFRGQECPAALHVNVKNRDVACQRALDAGAVIVGSAERDDEWVSDPFGISWFIGEGLGQVTPTLLPPPSHARPLMDFLMQAFGATVEGRRVHIGEAVVEMGEAPEEGTRPFGFYMATDDVDAVYRRALAAGAVSVVPPADQLYGDRLAIVADPAGNRWFATKRIATDEQ
jgi:PhnB protein